MLEMDERRFWSNIAITDFRDPEYKSNEALVYFVRHFLSIGLQADAWKVIEILVSRSLNTIRRKISGRVRSLDAAEELVDDLITQLYSVWMSPAITHEFWEIRFGFCLEKAIFSTLRKFWKSAKREGGIGPETDDFTEADRWANIPDQQASNPLERVALQSALAQLPEKESEVIFLYRIEQWDEEKIATHLNVTSRTIRNYLRRGEERLRTHLFGDD